MPTSIPAPSHSLTPFFFTLADQPAGRAHRAGSMLLALGLLLGSGLSTPSVAAEPELVGVLALALENDAADQLKLSDSQREALLDLVDQRELAGIDIAMAARNLSKEERLKKLASFREESVQQGLKLLNPAQRAKLTAMQAESENPAYAASPSTPEETTAAEEPAAQSSSQPSAPSKDDAPKAAGPKETEPKETEPKDAEPTNPDTKAASNGSSSGNQSTTSGDARSPSSEGPLSFNFRYQPWKDVLDWFAERADLSLVLESPPPGTFNYQDNRQYSIGEALDVLNSVLQTKGYTLVRKGRMLLLVNLEDGIPPNLVTDVPLAKLDERGEYEIVRVLFRVRNLLPDDAAEELEQMLGPQGKILVLPKAGMIQVTETAGRIRTLRSVIEAIEEPIGGEGTVQEFPLQYITADEALPVLRQMLGIPPDAMTTPTGSLQLAVDPLGMKLFAQGSAVQLRRLKEILGLVDVAGAATGSGVAQTPQLEVYPVPGIDPELVLNVLQTILAGRESTRLATDAQTGNLVALATPSEHATIRATLEQMQQDQRRVEVIPLDTVDPQLAVLSINKLFSGAQTGDEPDPRAPTVDADLTSRSLLVRASPAQIAQIKEFLTQLEDGQTSVSTTGTGNVRMLPISPSAARSALGQLEQLWPTLRPNRIRVITPSAAIPAYKPSEDAAGQRDPLEELLGPGSFLGPSSRETPQPAPSKENNDRSAESGRIRAHFAAQPLGAHEQAPQKENESAANSEDKQPKSQPGAEIIVAPGAGGTIIASADLEALDAFEQLLRNTASQSAAGGRQFAVFYLKYAEAGKAAETLAKVFGASSSTGGGLVDDLAGAALGGLGGGLMGDLLGLGGSGDAAGGFSSTSVDIVPDPRLNALVVYAQPADLDMIDQLLRVLDQRAGPEPVEAGGRPRLIPVVNTSAERVAEVVKQVFQDRLEGGGGDGKQPSPQELIRALRKGGGGGGGGSDQEPTKMSLGVDERSNSLVVRAPDPLFQQVEQLVKQLDEKGIGTPQSTRIVSLQHTSSTALRDALQSLLGEGAVTTSGGESSAPKSEPNKANADAARETMQRIEMFRKMRENMQQGGGRGGRGGEGRRGGERGGRRGGRGGGERGGGDR